MIYTKLIQHLKGFIPLIPYNDNWSYNFHQAVFYL